MQLRRLQIGPRILHELAFDPSERQDQQVAKTQTAEGEGKER